MTVAVQHALHCVQRLHRYMYKDHYHAGLSDEDAFALKQHTGEYQSSHMSLSRLIIRTLSGLASAIRAV